MPLVFATDRKVLLIIVIFSFAYLNALTQENTPWSRYGLGDPIPSTNILNRGMGYVTAGYNDQQTINFTNPASYSRLGKQRAILDLGLDFHSRTSRDATDQKASFSNIYIPYLAAGFQLKGEKRKRDWGVAFGLRPITKVSYNIENGTRFGGDSIVYNYEGNGGAYQAFMGTGISFKNLSIGINLGYRFGSKDYVTKVSIVNDSIGGRYLSGQKDVRNNFGGLFGELGLQYEINISEKDMLTLGAYGSVYSDMSLKSKESLNTFFQSGLSGSENLIDSVSNKQNNSGNIVYPSYGGFGFLYDRLRKSHLSIGADFSFQNWKEFRFNDKEDLLTNAWQIKGGVQWTPDPKSNSGKLKKTIIYRAGFIYAQEPFLQSGNLNSTGVTLGAGLPIRKYSYAEYNRNNIINLALEIGRRGNLSNIVRENYMRISLSASLSDIWFIKSKYD